MRDKKHLPVPNGATPSLLLMDNDRKELAALKRLLQPDGYQILLARSPAEAFKLLALHQVQVILCDQPLPSEKSVSFLDRVREMYPAVIRIVQSNEVDIETVTNAIYNGAIHRFYSKPRNDMHLRKDISDAFHHYNLLSNALLEPQLPKLQTRKTK